MSRLRSVALFLALSFVWGSGFIALKVGLSYFPPLLFAAIAYSSTALLLFPAIVARYDRWRPTTAAGWGSTAAIALFMVFLYNTFLYVGQRGTTGAISSIIVSLVPILVAVFAVALLPDEEIGAREVLGVVLGLLGVLVIVQPSPGNVDAQSISELLILLAAASTALAAVLVQRFAAAEPFPLLVVWGTALGSVGLYAVGALLGETITAAAVASVRPLASLFYLVVFVYAIGYLIYFRLLARFGAFEVSLVSYASPIATALVGWIVLEDRPSLAAGLGFLVILASFVVTKYDALVDEAARLVADDAN
jgi:drug/metabolite transporter (DMT)-like permease